MNKLKFVLVIVMSLVCFSAIADDQTVVTVFNYTSDNTFSMEVGQTFIGNGALSPNTNQKISWEQMPYACLFATVCQINFTVVSGLGCPNIATMFINIPNKKIIAFIPLDIPGYIVTFNSLKDEIHIKTSK